MIWSLSVMYCCTFCVAPCPGKASRLRTIKSSMSAFVRSSKQHRLLIYVITFPVRSMMGFLTLDLTDPLFLESLATLLAYVRALRFDETPDYDYCRELLDNALVDEVDDGVRDWMLLNNGKGWEVKKVTYTHHLKLFPHRLFFMSSRQRDGDDPRNLCYSCQIRWK